MKVFYGLLISLLLLPMGYALSISATILPASPTTIDTLNCQVTGIGSGALQANVTWYKDGNPFGSDNETLSLTSGVAKNTTSLGDIETSDTSRSQTWICEVTVWNGTATNITNSSSVAIENAPPLVTSPVTTQIVYEDSSYGPLMATATDPDGDPIVSWISSDLNSSLYGNSLFSIDSDGTIGFTPTAVDVGNHSMAILASDGDLFGGRTVLYTVLEVNDVPVLDALVNQNATEDIAFIYLVRATDEEDDLFNFTIDSDLSLTLTQLNTTHARISFTPTFADRGNHTVNVTVHEEGNFSHNSSNTFVLYVSAVNRVPQFDTIITLMGTQGSNVTIYVNATDQDSTDILNFSVSGDCAQYWPINTTNSSYLNAIGVVNITTLTNDHVWCNEFTIVVTDYEAGVAKSTNSTNITMNITNTNDAPQLYPLSYNTSNSYNMINGSNLSAPTGLSFTYVVNGSDIDSLTYEGEVLTYTDNSSLFIINSSTGEIQFTPLGGDVGTHIIQITLTDDQAIYDTLNLSLRIVSNSPPVLNTIANQSCLEDTNCSITVSANESDPGDNVTFSASLVSANITSNSNSSPSFSVTWINSNSSNLSNVFSNAQVGSYIYNLSASDRFGATDSALLYVTVNNSNDLPTFSIAPAFPTVVKTYQVSFIVNVSDDDLINNVENLTLNVSLLGPNTSLFSPVKLTESSWRIQFTPDENSDGDYSANFTVFDSFTGYNTTIVNFTVYNESLAPIITAVAPLMSGLTLNQTLSGIALTDDLAAVSIAENTAVTFNISFTDTDTASTDVTVSWYVDGSLVQSRSGIQNYAYLVSFDYFDEGIYNYTVVVEDDRYSLDRFSWNVTVTDVNRNPVLRSNFVNRSINSSLTITDAMLKFIDPDDDLNSNNVIDGSETSDLIYTATNSTIIGISFLGHDLTLSPAQLGSTTVYYTATDESGGSVNSNNVIYNVTNVPQSSTTTVITSSSGGGGGGGGGSSAIPIPVRDDPEPYSINIIAPEAVQIYYNQTMLIPLTVENTGDETLFDVNIYAQTQAENVTFSFSRNNFRQLIPAQSENLSMYVTNYRSAGTYEIFVYANVQNPEVNDSVVIHINSLEQTAEGDSVRTKITFARDLLASNPECTELNELLGRAQRAVDTGQAEEANKLIDAVVQGCRYLLSESNKREESPGYSWNWLLQFQYTRTVLIGLLITLLVLGGLLVMHYRSAHQDESNL